MTKVSNTSEWKALTTLSHSMKDFSVSEAFSKDSKRFDRYSIAESGLLLDYSKQKINEELVTALLKLAEQSHLKESIEQLFLGACVNTTEALPALHTALRNLNNIPVYVQNENIMPEINACLDKLEQLSEAIREGHYLGYTGKPIRDVVNIGVGGSDLGPAMVQKALEDYSSSAIKTHFISNLDSYHLESVLKDLNPETTLFVVASKSFSTAETQLNARSAWQWLKKSAQEETQVARHFFAVTAKADLAKEMGVPSDNILPLWDWVGGRFSVWSAVGFGVVISVGMSRFKEFLAGAEAMDQHFRNTSFAKNIPVMMALLGIWNQNFLGAHSQAIILYDQRLSLMPNYLQQLMMESEGKSTNAEAEPVDYTTGAVIWGGIGTNSQHAFHQLFMQGTQWVPIDFIVSLTPAQNASPYHAHLVANCLSQARVLMQGKSKSEAEAKLRAAGYSEERITALAPHLLISGSCPSNVILIEALTPYHLGALMALYEHVAYVQSVIWNIDAFDQWGVEWGKQLAKDILVDLKKTSIEGEYDASTLGLMQRYKEHLRQE